MLACFYQSRANGLMIAQCASASPTRSTATILSSTLQVRLWRSPLSDLIFETKNTVLSIFAKQILIFNILK